jgi:hypothetical protein
MTNDRPRGTSADDRIPAWAERLVLFLDDGFVIPGTSFRVGFDAVLGLVPGIGDFVTSTSSLSLIWLAQQRGVPQTVLLRMLLNLGVDALIGAVPVLGDGFDVVFKANRRNLELLKRHDRTSQRITGTRNDRAVNNTLFVVLVGVAVLLLLTVPIALAILIVRLLLD